MLYKYIAINLTSWQKMFSVFNEWKRFLKTRSWDLPKSGVRGSKSNVEQYLDFQDVLLRETSSALNVPVASESFKRDPIGWCCSSDWTDCRENNKGTYKASMWGEAKSTVTPLQIICRGLFIKYGCWDVSFYFSSYRSQVRIQLWSLILLYNIDFQK